MEVNASDVFEFLHDNVPSWMINLGITSQESRGRQASSAEGASSLDTCESPTEIHHLGNGDLQKVVVLPYGSLTDVTRQSSSTDYRRRQALSIGSDGTPAERDSYRARNAIVVNYDSNAQNRLENIVSGISRAKDMIRKATMARQRKVPVACRGLPGLSDADDDDDEMDDEMVLSQIRMSRHGGRTVTSAQKRDKEDTETTTDQHDALEKIRVHLDLAQDLCSDSAFQLLRDGNCVPETYEAIGELERVLHTMPLASTNSKAGELLHDTNHRRLPNDGVGDLKLPVSVTYRLNRRLS